jgi:hypothetical protein
MESSKELLILEFATQQDWEAWLAEHYADPTGIWLKIAKKATGTQSISYAEALEARSVMAGSMGRRPRLMNNIGSRSLPRAARRASGHRSTGIKPMR